jgi:hypothetical protein
MRFMMVIVHDLIHSYPAFLGSFHGADNRLEVQEFNETRTRRLNEHVSMQSKYVTEPSPTAGQVCSLAANRSRYRPRAGAALHSEQLHIVCEHVHNALTGYDPLHTFG